LLDLAKLGFNGNLSFHFQGLDQGLVGNSGILSLAKTGEIISGGLTKTELNFPSFYPCGAQPLGFPKEGLVGIPFWRPTIGSGGLAHFS